METTHSFFDETPTPTRYIRSCDEIGLFQDLQHNPFEETFRIAIESSGTDLSNGPLSKPNIEESLNTPQIITIAKSDEFQSVYQVIQEDNSEDIYIPAESLFIESVDADGSPTRTENENTSNDSADVEIIEEPIQQNGFATHAKISQPATAVSAIVTALPSSIASSFSYTLSSNSFKNRTIGNYVIQNVSTVPTSNSLVCGNLRKSVVKTNDKVADSPNVFKAVTPAKESDFLYQLSGAKLPAVLGGKNVVLLPSRNHVLKSSTTSVPLRTIMKKSEPVVQTGNADDVREKLRDILKANSSPLVSAPVTGERIQPIGRSDSGTISIIDEKREHSRERNRMAQKRCRIKKKKLMMQVKRENMNTLKENANLKAEVSNLRAEVAHLKTLLLAHRNCSLTRNMFKADLQTILNGGDISKIAEDVVISIPDSTDDSDSDVKVRNVFNHQQVNQVNHHVNHIHVHVPSAAQSKEELFETAPSRTKSGQGVNLPSNEIKSYTSSLTQNRRLIFDSKVVPIKPDDRTAFQKLKMKPTTIRSNVFTITNQQDNGKRLKLISQAGCRSTPEVMADNLPMQSTEVSGSTHVSEFEQNLSMIGNVIKFNPISRVENVDL